MPRISKPKVCVDCSTTLSTTRGRRYKHAGRGLCRHCHDFHAQHGTLYRFDRLTYSREERLAEIMHYVNDGLAPAQIAAQLGVTRDCIRKTLARSRDHDSQQGVNA